MVQGEEFSALIATHAVWLSAFLRGLTQCEADAEDAFQEVWVRVLKFGGSADLVSVRGYLARVARSVVIDRYRKSSHLVLTLDAEDEQGTTAVEALEGAEPSPAEWMEKQATHQEVLAAVRSLPEGQREVLLMRIEGELAFQEIAEILSVPLGTVLTWMRRGTERLKKLLR